MNSNSFVVASLGFYLQSIMLSAITRRDKKDFLSDQCKEMEENNRMGKTGDLFKKIGDTKGTFHAKMGTINDKYVLPSWISLPYN